MEHRSTHTVPLAHHPCVMLVEDDELNGEVLTRVLHAEGYRVDRCSDGGEALAHLRAGTAPDVIVLDLVMPNVNGWEFRVAQKRVPAWAEIPVIVMSGDSSAQASAIDADSYLAKPLDAPTLLGSLERVLRARDRARTTAHAAELERLDSLGRMAAGLTHEINNPLAFVAGNLELSRLQCSQLAGHLPKLAADKLAKLERLLEQAQRGAERIAELVRSVATFAAAGGQPLEATDVQDVIESSLQRVAHELTVARLERDYAAVPAVMGHPEQLAQVFSCLLLNAAQAIRAGDNAAPHSIRVATRLQGDTQVEVCISDSGRPLAADLVGHVFDPFFSSEARGAGMGLGLSICKRLIGDMGGTIRVESSQETGSTFRVTLRTHEHVPAEPQAPTVQVPAREARMPSVMVIDDEALMCELLRNMLQDEYAVTTFPRSRDALERLLSGPFVDVVLCDLMMPDLTGMDLHAELLAKRPEQAARFVFMTGGTFTERARNFLDSIEGPPLTKPFRIDALRHAVAARLQQFSGQPRDGSQHAYN